MPSVGTRLAKQEYEAIKRLVENGAYVNVSDFLRDAVREKLRGVEVVTLRDISPREARKEILRYMDGHSRCYPSDIALDLNLDYRFVTQIIRELIEEGEIEVEEE